MGRGGMQEGCLIFLIDQNPAYGEVKYAVEKVGQGQRLDYVIE